MTVYFTLMCLCVRASLRSCVCIRARDLIQSSLKLWNDGQCGMHAQGRMKQKMRSKRYTIKIKLQIQELNYNNNTTIMATVRPKHKTEWKKTHPAKNQSWTTKQRKKRKITVWVAFSTSNVLRRLSLWAREKNQQQPQRQQHIAEFFLVHRFDCYIVNV